MGFDSAVGNDPHGCGKAYEQMGMRGSSTRVGSDGGAVM